MAWNEKKNSGGVAARRSRTPAAARIAPVARIEVCIATDSRVTGEVLAWSLGQLRDLHAVAAVAPNPSAAADTHADVVLLDAEVRDSVNEAEALASAHPEARIIVTNLSPRDGRIGDFVKAGVAGFVLQDASLDELADTIRQVADGMTVLPAGLTQSLFSRVRDGAEELVHERDDVRLNFTRREHEVVDLVCVGLQNRAIGQRLNISCHTVRSHVRNVLAKLTLHSRHQLAAWAHKDHGTSGW
jgi:DNA-binding NarL/FixJ family response regulator